MEPTVEEQKTDAKGVGFVYGVSVKCEEETLALIDVQRGVSATPVA